MTIHSATQNTSKNAIRHPNWKPGGKGGVPLHVTGSATCKYQCNGPVTWGPKFTKIAEKVGGAGTFVGVGMRAALAFVMENEAMLSKLMAQAKDSPLRAIDVSPKAKKPAAKKPAAKKPAAKPAAAEATK
jgi:hypothetical protein